MGGRFSFNAQENALYLTAESNLGKGYERVVCDVPTSISVTLSLPKIVEGINHIDEDVINFEFHSTNLVIIKGGPYTYVIATISAQ